MATGKGVLRRAVDSWYKDFDLGKRFGGWLKDNTEQHNNRMGDAYAQFLNELGVDTSDAPFLTPGSPPAIIGGAAALLPMLLGMLLGAGIGVGVSVISPLTLKWSYGVSNKVRPWRPDPDLLDKLRYRFPGQAQLWDSIGGDLGIPENYKQFLIEASRPRLNPNELLRLNLRGELSEAELTSRLDKLGFGQEAVAGLRELANIIPAPQDLIGMAVREAFDDDVAREFQYDENFPSEFALWAERQGLSRDWAVRYWRAHWKLPSPNQVFEMLHRLREGKSDNPVNDDTVQLYLRTADISPFWRSRLKDISFRPITRVDVRRMYALLGWSRDELISRYRDLGYSPEDAANYADFTIQFEAPKERGLSQSAILQGFRRKVITEEETFEALNDIGIREDVARFYVSLEKQKENEKQVGRELKRIESLFMLGELDDASVYNELGLLDLAGEQLNRIVRGWIAKRKAKQVIPTKTELDRWYKFELISVDEYEEGLVKRNIHPDFVSFYIAETNVEISESRDKDYERSKKEQDRIRRDRRSSTYQKDKALLDVQLAEISVSIADMKVAIFLAEEPDLVDELKERILTMQKLLAEVRLRKANLRSDLEIIEEQEVQDNA